MAANEKKRILIADNELMSLATLIGTLKDDYHVITINSGKGVPPKLRTKQIDMIILNTNLPDMDGFEVCRKIKNSDEHKTTPIIFISSDNSVAAEAKGFEVGAVDYISKPSSAPIIKARIKNQLQLSAAINELQQLNKLALDANPKTGLPGNNSIFNELKRVIKTGDPASVIYADLDNFKIYNDLYGFAQGDEVISFTANVIRVALQSHGLSEAFLGHIGGDDFVLIIPAEKCGAVADEIIARIDRGICEFYRAEDYRRGYVVAIDREGTERRHPLISLSMGAVDLTQRRLSSPLEIIDICTETKKAAKSKEGSFFYLDRRK